MKYHDANEKDFIETIEAEDKSEFLEYPDEMTIHYQYSVGELTKFFKEIRENGKLYGTRCTKCGFGFFPPRLNCHKCYAPCEWVELSGEGTIIAGTLAHFGVSNFTDKVPITIAFIQLNGMDMAIRHTVVMESEDLTIENLRKGTKVKVQFIPKAQRKGRITDFYFILNKD